MKGRHHIVVESARLKYEFDIRRNITVVRGDSATGKTTLIDLLQAYSGGGAKSGVRVVSDVPCIAFSGDPSIWKNVLGSYSGSIIFIDENYAFMTTKEFAGFIRGSDNYYVLITRKELYYLPYSIREIYGIRTSGRFHFPEQIYHEFYPVYNEEYSDSSDCKVLITEDSNSGFQFFSRVLKETVCLSAEGNSKLYRKILDVGGDKNLIVIADGAAFGAFIEKVLDIAEIRKKVTLYFPESFEWLILKSGVIHSAEISDILEAPEEYADSRRYFSWKQLFTDVLSKGTADNPVTRYGKANLPEYYTGKHTAERILSVLPQDLRDQLS